MTPFFSIIIPIYNGLTHGLPRCIDSIYSQPLSTDLYEVLCVDDCSTDDTRQWLAEQQHKHANLKSIHNIQNTRQGGARNHGVREANGKYIMFIDQDDYFHPKAIAQVYEHLQKVELDVLVTDNAYQFEDMPHNNLTLNLPFNDITNPIDFVKHNGFAIAPWRLCLKREFFNEHNLVFEENCRIEDIDWGCKIYRYATTIQYQPILLVHYNKGESGQTDNMYRNIEILKANTIAANRTFQLSETIFSNHPLRESVKTLSDTYYNFTCRYLFGICKPIETKVGIIRLFMISKSSFRLVTIAMNHPYFYSVTTNLAVPLFRLLRTIKRKRQAKQLMTTNRN